MIFDPKVRFAVPADAPELDALVPFGPWKVNWEDATDNWLVAEGSNGEVLGCVCLYLGKPVGRAEHMAVRADLKPKEKHTVMMLLSQWADLTLRESGSEIVVAFVAQKTPSFKRLLKKRLGFIYTNSGSTYAAFREIE